MVALSPLHGALLTAQQLGMQLAEVRETVQYVLTSPLRHRRLHQPLTQQLAQATAIGRALATQLVHTREHALAQCVTTQLAQASATVQHCTEPSEPSQEGLRRVDVELAHTQETLGQVEAQLQHDLEQSPDAPEETP